MGKNEEALRDVQACWISLSDSCLLLKCKFTDVALQYFYDFRNSTRVLNMLLIGFRQQQYSVKKSGSGNIL